MVVVGGPRLNKSLKKSLESIMQVYFDNLSSSSPPTTYPKAAASKEWIYLAWKRSPQKSI
jgi:hypothetical protein